MAVCRKCGGPLGDDDEGATLKFYDRCAEEYFCFSCLCGELGCSEEYLKDRIEFLRRAGCSMFQPRGEKQL